MSERILQALMRLFAIIAKVDYHEDGTVYSTGRDIVELFLRKQLNAELVKEYLELFDEFLAAHHKASKRKDGSRKRTSLNSVKVLRICTQINEELTQRQKIIVLLRLLEFINADGAVTTQEDEFVTTVAETFNIEVEEYKRISHFVLHAREGIQDSPYILTISQEKENPHQEAKHIHSDGIDGELRILRVTSVGIYILRYLGTKELFLNGQIMTSDRNNILTNGSSIRSAKVQPIYYSDIIAAFMSDTSASRLVFRVDHVKYMFKGGKIGLHDITFTEESGKLIGIMGGSGAGKSTLLNVLNGNYIPSEGAVTINGLDIHRDPDSVEGVIGHISQDDLLIEELTVFQNLFYNAKLCFADLNDGQIAKLVLQMLQSLGLYETRDLKVGSPLDKTISGGQRKRLNIALELIREPSVLFVDEPTSGLSSRDSENIMDLLKELALKGKLLFVVIHQPSSDIFKMFDKLMILDQGGYPIYYGNPVDAVIYFKKEVNHVNADESECMTCGNVNPEQIFNIIESKVVDEFGNLTQHRKISPIEWNETYLEYLSKKEPVPEEDEIPASTFHPPGKLKQFKVFLTRDVLSKLTNRQYILVNLLEAPILAAILSFFVKFYHMDSSGEAGYIFRENENLPQYLFMSVVVALFIGLTVSAEEIIRDQRILKREQFLNLSRGSYLFSKITIMFAISAIQTLLFVLVGNLILEIKGMTLAYWLVMFSTSCFANMLGLNISASFNSAKVIYILIPFLIIPQLLFSGVIVKFDKLIPTFASQSSVPLIGNVMASRWAYEALAVTQFKDNEYEESFFKYDLLLKSYNWKKDVWHKNLDKRSGKIRRHINGTEYEDFEADLAIIRTELEKVDYELDQLRSLNLLQHEFSVPAPYKDNLTPEKVTEETLDALDNDLDRLFEFYKQIYKSVDKSKDSYTAQLTEDSARNAQFLKVKETYENESLSEFVTNKNNFGDVSVIEDGEIIQKSNPVYLIPFHRGLFGAHFYAPKKKVFGQYIDTFWANLLVLWLMSILLLITLYFDFFRKLFEAIGRLFETAGSLVRKRVR